MTSIKHTIGSLICKLRKSHDWRRGKVEIVLKDDKGRQITVQFQPSRICRRCGHVVPVQVRGPRKTKETI